MIPFWFRLLGFPGVYVCIIEHKTCQRFLNRINDSGVFPLLTISLLSMLLIEWDHGSTNLAYFNTGMSEPLCLL